MHVGLLIYYLSKVAAQTPPIPLYLDGDILHNSYIEFIAKVLYLSDILIYILNHMF